MKSLRELVIIPATDSVIGRQQWGEVVSALYSMKED